MASVAAKKQESSSIIHLPTFDGRRDANPTDELTAANWLNERVEFAKRHGVFSEEVVLSPAIASVLLNQNAANRNIRLSKLRQYEADAKEKRWEMNGESIKVSDAGELNDGQHRCFAVINTLTPIKTVMTFGVGRDTRRTLDIGAKRNAEDYLTIEGVKNAQLASSAARMVIGYELGGKKFIKGRSELSTVKVIERVQKDQRLQEAAAMVHHMKRRNLRGVVTPAVITFCYYLFAKKNPGQAQNFFDAIIYPNKVEEGHPARTTRDRLENLTVTTRDTRAEIILRGWNLLRDGKTHESIPIMGEFPKIR